jgi:hypothetical protein
MKATIDININKMINGDEQTSKVLSTQILKYLKQKYQKQKTNGGW